MALRKLIIDSKSQLNAMAKDNVVVKGTEDAPEVILESIISYSADQIPTMTSNTTPSGVASASSEASIADPTWYKAWRAMNDIDAGDDCWHTADGMYPPHWLRYQFTSGKIIERYTITARDGDPPNTKNPTAWKLQGSNNSTDWVDLDSQIEQSFTRKEKKTYTFSNSTLYTYYQLYITACAGDYYVAIGECELMEKNPLEYLSPGTLTSQPNKIDAITLGMLRWVEELPAGTDITFATRAGPTGTPDANWSAWSGELTDPVASQMASPPDVYIQFRATLTTTDASKTPRLYKG